MSLPNAYAATTDAARNDATHPHMRRRIPWFALSVATRTLTKAHNRAPTNNAVPESSPGGVGMGIGPVLPMFFCAASVRQTNDLLAHTHQKLTDSSSRSSLPLCAHPTPLDPRAVAAAKVDLPQRIMGEIRLVLSRMHAAQVRSYADFRQYLFSDFG